MIMDKFNGLLIIGAIFLCGVIAYNFKNINLFFTRPIISSQINLKVNSEYDVKRINIIDSNHYGVLVKDGLYYITLHYHVSEDARNDILNLVNQIDRLIMKVNRVDGSDVFVDFIVYHGNDKFKLRSWLTEKGKVFKN